MGIITNKPGRQNVRKIGRKGKLYKPYGFGQEGATPVFGNADFTTDSQTGLPDNFTIGYNTSVAASNLDPTLWFGGTIKLIEVTNTGLGTLQYSGNTQAAGVNEITVDYEGFGPVSYVWTGANFRYQVAGQGALRTFLEAVFAVPIRINITDTTA